MSETTAKLDLPYILPAQAQKHVTHNDALRMLDAVVQVGVLDRHLAAPPTAPAEGDRHIPAAGASGAWTGQSGKIAAFQDGAWAFYAPQTGWLVWIADEGLLAVWDGGAWVSANPVPTLNPAPLVGVNTTADGNNRLAVSSPAALFNHAGAGHQIKINKAAAADTASLLFQTDFSGRAEMGTAGDDNFHFKVSADGAAWSEAIVIDRSTGAVTFPNTPIAGAVAVDDEGSQVQAAATRINFTGGGVTATNSGAGLVTVNVPSSSGAVPPGGAAGQVLAKASAADFNVAWVSPPTGGGTVTVVPAYGNSGGQGDRTGVVTVTASAGLANPSYSLSNFIDGAMANNTADSAALLAVAVTGHFLQFDFGPGASKVITEATWKQSGAQNHGTWKWQGSNDGSAWSDIGAGFALGGATVQVQTTLAANDRGFRFYRLFGVSGTASSAPFIQEIEFKIGSSIVDSFVPVPAGGAPRQALIKTSPTNFAVAWSNPQVIYPMHTSEMLAEWYFDEGSGTQAGDVRGGNAIVFDGVFQSTWSAPAPQWTRRGVRYENSMIQTPTIAGVRTIAMLYRVKRGDTGFILSGGPSNSVGPVGGTVAPSMSCHIGGGQGVAPLARRPDSGAGATRTNRGGWALLFVEYSQQYTSAFGFGGRHSSTLTRCAEFEVAWAGCWSDQLTDTERATVYDCVRRIASSRGLFIDWRDCPTHADCALLWGQSNADGRALITDLPASDQARKLQRNVFIQPASSGANGYASPELLVMGENQQATSPATQFGPEMGAAWAREDADTSRLRALVLGKTAVGSSYLAPSSVGAPVTPSASWHPGEINTSGLLWLALSNWWDLEQRLLQQGIGPRLRALWWMQGEQDAVLAGAASGYQANLQALWDATKLYTSYASASGIRVVVARIRDQGAGMIYAADVRSAQSAFVAGNSSEAVLIDTDTYPLGTDLTHYAAAGQKSLGQALYNAVGW